MWELSNLKNNEEAQIILHRLQNNVGKHTFGTQQNR